MRPRTIKRLAAWVLIGAVAGAWFLLHTDQANAQPYDPHVPMPPVWCPGNPPGQPSVTGFGGYCEGKSYPDGTRWNAYAISWFWQPIRCIIPDGSAMPPLAPAGGCGGSWGGQ